MQPEMGLGGLPLSLGAQREMELRLPSLRTS